MTDKEVAVDYNIVDKNGSNIVWTKVALDMCAQLLRETDNRNPAVFNLKAADPEYLAAGELEVIENHLRSVLKVFKIANKKKSPQSAWKPVYASLEALTIYLQTKSAWISSIKDATRAANAFTAFGCAWVSAAEKLNELGLLGENTYPSVRCAMNTTIQLGNELNEKAGRLMSDWPNKLESVWTGTEYAGDKKKKKHNPQDDDVPKKSKSKKKKGEEGDEDDADASGKKKKGSKKVSDPFKDEEPANPWDFEVAIDRLKADRKQIGGNSFDIAVMTEELRAKLAVAAN